MLNLRLQPLFSSLYLTKVAHCLLCLPSCICRHLKCNISQIELIVSFKSTPSITYFFFYQSLFSVSHFPLQLSQKQQSPFIFHYPLAYRQHITTRSHFLFSYTSSPHYLRGIRSRTPRGCLKLQVVPNPVYTMVFPVSTHL